MTLEPYLLSAIGALASAIAVVWRQLQTERRENAKIIFALLGKVADARNELPPPTVSTVERPVIEEAKKLAMRALGADWEPQVRAYLKSDPPVPPVNGNLH